MPANDQAAAAPENTNNGVASQQENAATLPTGNAQPNAENAQQNEGHDSLLKGGEEKPVDGEGKAQESKAPESYEFKAPDGKTFDPGVITEYSSVAKELGLSQEHAQKLLDVMAPKLEARQIEQINQVRQEWLEATKVDKEIGGDNLMKNVGIANAAVTKFASPELVSLMKSTGLANHPEMVRLFYRVGKAVSDDNVVTGAGSSSDKQSMYPNSNHTK